VAKKLSKQHDWLLQVELEEFKRIAGGRSSRGDAVTEKRDNKRNAPRETMAMVYRNSTRTLFADTAKPTEIIKITFYEPPTSNEIVRAISSDVLQVFHFISRITLCRRKFHFMTGPTGAGSVIK
jgi:hypothetical protein